MDQLQIEYVDIREVKPYANNAKIHTDEQISQIIESIKLFGMNDPIAVWKDGEIIEGHGRLIACEKLGMKKVPVIRLDVLTDEQRRAYMNIHNQLTMNTGFDIDLLAEELGKIENIDMSMFGFDIAGDNEEAPEAESDNYVEPESLPARVKPGQVWQLGQHRLMCGDSTKTEDVEKLLGGGVRRFMCNGSSIQRSSKKHTGHDNTERQSECGKIQRILDLRVPEYITGPKIRRRFLYLVCEQNRKRVPGRSE